MKHSRRVVTAFMLSRLISFLLIAILLISGSPFAYANLPADKEYKFYYYLHDNLGGIQSVLDDKGNVVCTNDYLPYGEERNGDCMNKDEEDYGFTGKEKDEETGLMYYGARYYDPVIGRFTSMDPWEGDLKDPQTLNKYSYARNNPIFFIDPTGMYIMKTGEVEKGDNLSKITGQLNQHYGTGYSVKDIAKINGIDNASLIHAGNTITIGTLDGWRPSMTPITGEGYWNSLTETQQKILNFHSAFYQNKSDLPKTLNSRNEKEWTNPRDATAHNIGTSGNVEIRGLGTRAGQQAIYDKDGNLVEDSINGGTFDFVTPKPGNYHAHLRVDVKRWIEWGNSPADTTTRIERMEAFRSTTLGKIGYKYLKHEYGWKE